MARILDRLSSINAATPRGTYTWAQRVCEQIEAQFTDILTAIASMSEVPPVVVEADYTGTVTPSDQLPYEVAIQRFSGQTDVTTGSAWSVAVNSGSVTCSIGAATGLLSITAVGASGNLTVTSVYGGITKTRLVVVTKNIAAPPSTGGTGGGGSSGTTASDTTFSSINSTTHAPISDELTVTVGSAGIVTLAAPLTVRTTNDAVVGTYPVFGQWQWYDTGSATWTDVAAEVESDPDCNIHERAEGGTSVGAGSITVNTSKTGLVAAASEKFRLMARNSTGTRVMTFTGTASAVAS